MQKNIENRTETKEYSTNKKRLLFLENTGEYVFHGSANGGIEKLEPRQAKNMNDDGVDLDDGNPSVCATPYVEIAIFRSVLNRGNITNSNYYTQFGTNRMGEFNFAISNESAFNEARGKKGYIYVLDKKDFYPYDRKNPDSKNEKSMEWRAEREIIPKEVIEVDFEDLPENIEIVAK